MESPCSSCHCLNPDKSSVCINCGKSLKDKTADVEIEPTPAPLSNTYKMVSIALSLLLLLSIGGIMLIENHSHAQLSELQGKIQTLENVRTSLEQDNAKLRETADFYYKQGVDLQTSGDLSGAKDAFDAVVSKFPTSPLVGHAQLQVGLLDTLIAKAAAEAEAEEARKQVEQERLTREQGEPIDFEDLYARAKSTGLPIGKRFRFTCTVADGELIKVENDGDTVYSKILRYESAFDDEMQHQKFLRGQGRDSRTVVASMGSDGLMQVHNIE